MDLTPGDGTGRTKRRRGAARGRFAIAALALLAGFVLAPARAAELLVFEQKGCPFCEAFDAEIAPHYGESAIGRLAPLRRVNIHDDRRGGIPGLAPAVFTPTFVLLGDDAREIGRLEGYPGERWFYPEIEAVAARLPGFGSGQGAPVQTEGEDPAAGPPPVQATPVPVR